MLQVIIRSSLLRAGTEFTFLLYNWKTISFRIEHFLYSTITKLSSRSDNVMHCSSTGLLLCWLRRNSLQQQQQLSNALCFFCCGERCFAFVAWQLLAVSTKKSLSSVQIYCELVVFMNGKTCRSLLAYVCTCQWRRSSESLYKIVQSSVLSMLSDNFI